MIRRRTKSPSTVIVTFTIASVSGYSPVVGKSEKDERIQEALGKLKRRHKIDKLRNTADDKSINRSSTTDVHQLMREFRERERLEMESSKSDVYSRNFVPKKYQKNSEEYGRPPKGSMTEKRAKKASKHIAKEMVQLCEVIEEYGRKVGNENPKVVINFGDLFKIYQFISDKVVGMLLRARKHNMVDFEGEMLYQRRDEHKLITLLLSHEQIEQSRIELS